MIRRGVTLFLVALTALAVPAAAHAGGKKKKPKDAAPIADHVVADFETTAPEQAALSKVERVQSAEAPQGEWILRWSAIQKGARFELATPPKDCRNYRALSLRVRAVTPQPGTALWLYLPSNTEYGGRNLQTTVPLEVEGWRTVTIPLFKFFQPGKSHWGDVRGFFVGTSGPIQNATVELDDIRFLGGSRGMESCKESDAARVARVFAERAERVKTLKTKHYLIYTDSKPAGAKFQRALEKIYRFVTKRFGFAGREEPLIAYIFQNKADYHAFVIREKVLDRFTAKASAGVGCARFYATFYQAPEAPVVVHEATHQLVHALGKCGGGGSWFQEGWAVFSERAYFGKDPAKDYNWRIKLKQYTPLDKLIRIPVLLSGANASRNYAQAGALFSFLVQGPYAKKFTELRDACAKGGRGGDWAQQTLETIYGMPLNQLSDEWAAWTAKRK